MTWLARLRIVFWVNIGNFSLGLFLFLIRRRFSWFSYVSYFCILSPDVFSFGREREATFCDNGTCNMAFATIMTIIEWGWVPQTFLPLKPTGNHFPPRNHKRQQKNISLTRLFLIHNKRAGIKKAPGSLLTHLDEVYLVKSLTQSSWSRKEQREAILVENVIR